MSDSKNEHVASALMEGLLMMAAVKQVLLNKQIITENELAEALAQVVSEVHDNLKEQLSSELGLRGEDA